MLVANDVRRDPRVDKEARALVRSGRSLTVIGVAPGKEEDEELAEAGYRIVRIVPEGSARARVKAELQAKAPALFSAATALLRRARGLESAATGTRVAKKDPASSLERKRRSLVADVRTHTERSLLMAWAAIKTRPRVVHAHDLNTLQAAAWAALATGAALVFDAHELWWAAHEPGLAPDEWVRFYQALEEELIGKADLVLTVSDSIADLLAERHAIRRPTLVRNTVDPARIVAVDPRELHESHRPVEVLYHGGFLPNRGLEALLRAAPSFEGAHLVLRGFGALEESLRREVAERHLEGVVRFSESVPMREVVSAASRSDIGVIPFRAVSLNNKLAAPNKLFEYLQAGLAIAGSDIPELRKIVTQHGIGALFDPEDATSIARAVNQLASDPENLTKMRRRSFEAARSEFSWAHDEARLLAGYDRILGAGPSLVSRFLRRR